MSSDLRVRGGSGGTAAQLEDLDAAVVRLRSSAAALDDAAADLGLGRSLLDGLAGLAAGPGGVLELEGDVVAAVRRLRDGGDQEDQLATAVQLAAAAYRQAEATADGLWVVTRFTVVAASPLLLSAAVGALPAVGAFLRDGGDRAVPDAEETARRPTTGLAGPLGGGAPSGQLGPDRLVGALAAPAPVGGMTAQQMTDAVVAGVPGATGAGAAGGPSVGVRLADPGLLLSALVGTVVGGAGAVVAGRSPSPRVARGLLEVGAVSGTADATRVTTAVVPVPAAVATAGPPSGTGAVMARVRATADEHTGPAGRVRVEVVTAADGRRSAIVYMPGVQDWDPDSRNPMSAGTALRAEAGMPSAYTDLVVQALEEAGVARDEPVMLAGHSLGGIAAAQVAGDPAVAERFTVTTVVTAGSPVGAADVPPGVTVLSMEHPDDLVPALDLAPSPDAPGRTTVVAPTPEGLGAHDGDGYVELAERVDASDEPSLVAWREHLAPFTAGPGATSAVTEVVGRTVDPTPHG
ncbi:hypothetical protein [Quadrisphaera sp. INWT6]|uniref:hypothetical protein n=1 Tax=Quadrisphaera sp. INWT6 TaxID=2596917 RepID=UPI00189252C7|nr:hypothetical protein [Quadrisphaera sp. INWT6]MBF5083323.1 hypothetical protein [Quadrisphaera sp. INWT6]